MEAKHIIIMISSIFVLMFSMLLIVAILFSDEKNGGNPNIEYGGVNVSAEVLAYKPIVEKYAKEYGISEYVNYLLAIMQVESGGTLQDVMQSSESEGLPANTLSPEESIKQGCKYFASLLKAANNKDCDTNTVVQSYNYGEGFIDYVAGQGKKYTFELAENFANEKSGGSKVNYDNPIAVKEWRMEVQLWKYILCFACVRVFDIRKI